jgi:tryptophanyl-tRNA synthetase
MAEIAANDDYLEKILTQGTEKARESAKETINETRKLMGFRKY